jgi:hypothetical protein
MKIMYQKIKFYLMNKRKELMNRWVLAAYFCLTIYSFIAFTKGHLLDHILDNMLSFPVFFYGLV